MSGSTLYTWQQRPASNSLVRWLVHTYIEVSLFLQGLVKWSLLSIISDTELIFLLYEKITIRILRNSKTGKCTG